MKKASEASTTTQEKDREAFATEFLIVGLCVTLGVLVFIHVVMPRIESNVRNQPATESSIAHLVTEAHGYYGPAAERILQERMKPGMTYGDVLDASRVMATAAVQEMKAGAGKAAPPKPIPATDSTHRVLSIP